MNQSSGRTQTASDNRWPPTDTSPDLGRASTSTHAPIGGAVQSNNSSDAIVASPRPTFGGRGDVS